MKSFHEPVESRRVHSVFRRRYLQQFLVENASMTRCRRTSLPPLLEYWFSAISVKLMHFRRFEVTQLSQRLGECETERSRLRIALDTQVPGDLQSCGSGRRPAGTIELLCNLVGFFAICSVA